MLQNILNDSIIIPVIEDDKPNIFQKENISGLVMSSHILLHSNNLKACSLPNNKNMLEVLYAKKEYSLFTGLVDCVSYFLSLKQKNIDKNNITQYKLDIFGMLDKLPGALLRNDIINMEYDEENGQQVVQ